MRAEVVEAAAMSVLVPGERITSRGICWAAVASPRTPVLLLARHQYILVLTDRRLLVFRRRHRALAPSDLVIAKRYEAFTLEKVARSRPLMQVRLQATHGNRFVFEFRPRQRELGGELVARMTPRNSDVMFEATTETDSDSVSAPATQS